MIAACVIHVVVKVQRTLAGMVEGIALDVAGIQRSRA